MRQLKEIKKEMLDFFNSYCKHHGLNASIEITPKDNNFQILIFEKILSHRLFHSNPPSKVKLIPKDELLKLNNHEVHKLITSIIEDDEESPFLGPRINQ